MEQVSSGLLGLGARKERQWPPELLPLAHGLYNLQRSPMLAGPAMLPYAVHPDERLLLMLQLLAAGCAASVAQVCVCVLGGGMLSNGKSGPWEGRRQCVHALTWASKGADGAVRLLFQG